MQNDQNGKLKRVQAGFDPMTGKPVYQQMIRTGFDPMTGEPMYVKAVQKGFDGMTGEPLYVPETEVPQGVNASAQSAAMPQRGYANTQSAPTPQGDYGAPQGMATPQGGYGTPQGMAASQGVSAGRKRMRKPAIVAGIAAAAVLAIGGGVFAAVRSGLFMDKYDKVLSAAYNTLDNDRVGGIFTDLSEVVSSDSVEVEAKANVTSSGQPFSGNIKFVSDRDNFQFRADGEYSYGTVSLNGSAYLDENEVQVSLPAASNHIYQLSFDAPDDSYISRSLQNNSGMTMKDVSEMIREFAELIKDSDSIKEDLIGAVRDSFKEMNLQEIDSKTVTVNGESRDLTGYALVVSKEDVVRLTRNLIEVMKENQSEDLLKKLKKLGVEIGSMDEMYSGILDAVCEIDEFSETFDIYLYNKQLAGLSWKNEQGDGFSLNMKGDDSAIASCFDLIVTSGGEDVMKISRESKYTDGMEKGTLSATTRNGESESIRYSYNEDSGDFTIDVPNGEETYTVKGVLKTESDSIEFSTDLNVGSDVTGTVSLTMNTGARAEELSGDVYDIAEKSEEELSDEMRVLQEQSALDDIF